MAAKQAAEAEDAQRIKVAEIIARNKRGFAGGGITPPVGARPPAMPQGAPAGGMPPGMPPQGMAPAAGRPAPVAAAGARPMSPAGAGGGALRQQQAMPPPGMAAGGSIDGCATRGKTRARRG
jgi:hypothetical protein